MLESDLIAQLQDVFADTPKGAKIQIEKFQISVNSFLEPRRAHQVIGHWLANIQPEKPAGHLRKVLEAFKILRGLEWVVGQNPEHPLNGLFNRSLNDLYDSWLPIGLMVSFSKLLCAGIVPTAELEMFVEEEGQRGITYLNNLQEQTRNGNFDPKNLLQRDLEFTTYLLKRADSKLAGRESKNPSFLEHVEFYDPTEERTTPELSTMEELEADAAALEAAPIYWLVKDRVDRGKNVVVIGNNRYGELFVTRPLERALNELNQIALRVRVRSNRVSSSESTPSFIPTLGGNIDGQQRFIKALIDESPDILIIDGTRTSGNLDQARLPGSMRGYLNWFLAFNEACDLRFNNPYANHVNLLRRIPPYQELVQTIAASHPIKPYRISHWVPNPTSTIVIGDLDFAYQEPNYEQPNVILVNPVNTASDHQSAYYDDYDGLVSGQPEFVFTKYGLQKISTSGFIFKNFKTSEQLLSLVQARMESKMEEMIRKTNPINL